MCFLCLAVVCFLCLAVVCFLCLAVVCFRVLWWIVFLVVGRAYAGGPYCSSGSASILYSLVFLAGRFEGVGLWCLGLLAGRVAMTGSPTMMVFVAEMSDFLGWGDAATRPAAAATEKRSVMRVMMRRMMIKQRE